MKAMNEKWKEIVDAATDAVPDDVDSTERAMAMVLRNVTLFTVIECAKIVEAVQLKENGTTIIGKHLHKQFIKALKESFGLEAVQ